MMMRFLKSWPALVLVAALAASGTVRAGFQVKFEDVGTGFVSGPTNVTNGGSLSSVAVDGFSISGVFTLTNNPGTSAIAKMSINDALVSYTGNLSSDTLRVWLSADGFSSPTGPQLTLQSSSTGQVYGGTLTGGDFTSYANADNTLFSTAGFASPTITFASVGEGGTFGQPQSNPAVAGPFSLSAKYSLTSVGNYTLTQGTQLTGTLGYSAVVVPEPASVVMAGIGVAGLAGASFWRRRRLVAIA